MGYLSQPPTAELSRDLDACRQLPALLFAVGDVGTQSDITYAPVKVFDTDPFTSKFLRMLAKTEGGSPMASLELVEHDVLDGTEMVKMGYAVEEGCSMVVQIDPIPLLGDVPKGWPTILQAPQMNNSLHNFMLAEEAREVEPEGLLDELMLVRRIAGRRPHIGVREATGLDLQGYEVDLLQRRHCMPAALAELLRLPAPSSETLQMTARYQGQTVLAATVQFNGRGQLIGFAADDNTDPNRHIAAIAQFKRAVFN